MQTAIYLLAAASAVSAHTRFTELDSSTTKNAVGFGVRVTPNDSPVTDVTSNDIVCNVAGVTTSTNVIPVVAGTSVTATWTHGSDVIADSHVGPVMAYLKKVTDATTDSGTGDGWFKVFEEGLDVATSKWGVNTLIDAKGLQTIPIPACLEDGQYLVRTELIALHSAATANGAQFYGGCGQISVTGGTSVKTPATVAFPGAYSATDPGILIEIYWPKLTNYTIPGPEVFTCDASSSSASTGSDSAAVSSAPAVATYATPTTMVTSVKASSSAPAATKEATVKAADVESTEETPTTSEASTPSSTPASSASVPASTSATGTDETVPEMPTGTTMNDLLKWLSDMINSMLKQ